MDFFERLFHISPDGGSGSLEALYVFLIAAAFATAAVSATRLRRRAAKRPTRHRN